MKLIRWLLSNIILIALVLALTYAYVYWDNLTGEDTPAGKAIAYLSVEYDEVREFLDSYDFGGDEPADALPSEPASRVAETASVPQVTPPPRPQVRPPVQQQRPMPVQPMQQPIQQPAPPQAMAQQQPVQSQPMMQQQAPPPQSMRPRPSVPPQAMLQQRPQQAMPPRSLPQQAPSTPPFQA